MACSVSRQEEPNPALWLATQAGKMELSWPLRSYCSAPKSFPEGQIVQTSCGPPPSKEFFLLFFTIVALKIVHLSRHYSALLFGQPLAKFWLNACLEHTLNQTYQFIVNLYTSTVLKIFIYMYMYLPGRKICLSWATGWHFFGAMPIYLWLITSLY